jgi:hypothetical protein
MLYDFLSMMGNYEARKVDRFEKGALLVDTALVTDSYDPYETAVAHPAYNNGKWVIVETYKTKEAAQSGHKRWVEIMTADELPKELKDVSTAETSLWRDIEGDDWRTKEYLLQEE